MAERRMFAKSVTQSGRFCKLSHEAQLLYFALGMAADDDGAVEAYPVLSMFRIRKAAARELEAAGLIGALVEEEDVYYITDWLRNNQLRADTYRPSVYRERLEAAGAQTAAFRKRSGNGAATERQRDVNGVNGAATERQRDVNAVKESIGKESIGKESIGKVSIGKVSENRAPDPAEETGAALPSREDCERYFQGTLMRVTPMRDPSSEADAFFDYYAARGWELTGGIPCKDWKALARGWAKNGRRYRGRETVRRDRDPSSSPYASDTGEEAAI